MNHLQFSTRRESVILIVHTAWLR